MTASGAYLRVYATGREFQVGPGTEWLVGRDSRADLQVMDPLVSRMHAVVHRTAQGWRVTDLGSENGIWRDGVRVAHTPVGPGSVTIRLGGPDGPSLHLVPAGVTVPVPSPGGPGPATPREAVGPAGPVPPAGSRPGRVAASHPLVPGALRIGRALSNAIVLPDLMVSREHAQVSAGGDGTTLLDLGSDNGTYVNGRPVRRCRLTPGDLISIGPHRLWFEGTRLDELDDSAGPEFSAARLSVVVDGGVELLHDVSFSLPPRTLMAVVGPSGAGKSTLLDALSGLRPADTGRVLYAGRELYRDYRELRQRIGFVPQQDILHRVLTVEQALGFGARLRFPPETTADERTARVRQVAAELRLTHRLGARIDRLSGGERKRASTALELLTRPDLLFLDEPTSGLDVDLDREVMQQLRALADDGRTVLVVTHNLEHLQTCDLVLVLTQGGRVAYLGPPGSVLDHFGASTWADVFAVLKTRSPAAWAEAFAAQPDRDPRSFPPPDPATTSGSTDRGSTGTASTGTAGSSTGSGSGGAVSSGAVSSGAVSTGAVSTGAASTGTASTGAVSGADGREPGARRRFGTQLATQLHRQLAVTVADRTLLAILTLLPAALALLSLGIPHRGGLSRFPHNDEAPELLLVLVIGSSLMGAGGTVRELVKERSIHLRERAVGVSWSAYLLAKVVFFGGVAAAQGLALTALTLLGRTPPAGAVVLPWPVPEIAVVVAGIAVVSALLGLLVSALVRDEAQGLPLLVLLTMGQLVGSGSVVPVVHTEVLRELSWLLPARWGFAAIASTVDLQFLRPELPHDPWWNHGPAAWWTDLTGLVVLGLVTVGLTAVLVRRLDPRSPRARVVRTARRPGSRTGRRPAGAGPARGPEQGPARSRPAPGP